MNAFPFNDREPDDLSDHPDHPQNSASSETILRREYQAEVGRLRAYIEGIHAARKNVWRPSNADDYYEWHGVDELLAAIGGDVEMRASRLTEAPAGHPIDCTCGRFWECSTTRRRGMENQSSFFPIALGRLLLGRPSPKYLVWWIGWRMKGSPGAS